MTALLVSSVSGAGVQNPTMNVGDNLGTFSAGRIEYALFANGGAGACTWQIASGALPDGLSLRTDLPSWFPPNASAGIIGVATVPGQFPFSIGVTCDGLTTIQATTMKITSLNVADQYWLPDAFVGQPYTFQFHATGAAGDATWTLNGSLPPGLALGADGVISGTPTSGGFFNLGATLTSGGDSIGFGFGINVFAVRITSDDQLPNATQNQAYAAQIQVDGGTGPYSYSVGGSLPSGLSLDPASGAISGTTNAGPGNYSFWLSVTDATSASYTRRMAIDVVGVPKRLPSISQYGSTGWDDCTYGVSCSRGVSVWSGGTAPFTWSATGLPAGLAISSTHPATNWIAAGDGEISGVPLEQGTFQVGVTVTDADGASVTNTFPLTVSPLMVSEFNGSGMIHSDFSSRVRVIGGQAPYTATIVGGQLPAGLSLDPATQVISGTPNEGGNFNVLLRLTDSAPTPNRLQASVGFQISGGTSTIAITTYWDLGSITTGVPYSNQLWTCCVSATTWSVVGGALPPGVTLSSAGVLSGTPTVSGTYTFLAHAVDANNGANLATQQFTLVVTPLALSVNTQLPTGFVATPYATMLSVTGGTGAITWTLAPYSYLPPGLALAPDGTLGGTPSASGQYNFNATAADTAGHALTRSFNISIYPFGVTPPVAISQGSNLGTWSIGEIEQGLNATGGNGTYTWAVVAGELPPGVSLRVPPDLVPYFPPETSAALVGIATVPGTYNFTLRVTSGAAQADQSFTVTITSLRSLDQGWLPNAVVGQPYSYALTAGGGTGSVTWTPNTPLPPGLTLSTDGVLSGTPTSAGSFGGSFLMHSGADTIGSGYSIYVSTVRIITSERLPNATQNAAYSASIQADGGTAPYNFTVNGGLPFGLSLDPATGIISGTPTAGPGNYVFSLTVTDATLATNGRQMAINVIGVPKRLASIAPYGGTGWDDCTVGVGCTRGVSLSGGGTAPFTWTATGLPAGLTLASTPAEWPWVNPGDADIVGVPAEVGTFPVEIRVTDADGVSTTNVFSLRVSPLMARDFNGNGALNGAFSSRLRVIGGQAPYTATIVAGRLPAGLSLDAATQVVSGTPLETGGFNVTLRITDSSPTPNTLQTSQGLWIGNGASTLNINTYWDLGSITTGAPFSMQLWSCCAGATTWSQIGGMLPTGMTLSAGGLLNGTPAVSGIYNFLVQAVDAGNAANVAVSRFTLTVSPLILSVNTQLPTGFVATSYATTLSVTGGTGAISWTLAPFSYLPPGLALAPDGALTGTPTSSGQFNFNLTATDTAGHALTRSFNISIYPFGVTPPVAISQGPDLGTWSIGDVEFGLIATGGNGSYSWAVVGGALPPGVSLRMRPDLSPWFSSDTSAGLIGIATVPGTYSFTLRVTSGSAHTDQTFTVKVATLYGADQYQLPDAFVGRPYSYALTYGGSAGPVTWTPTSPLPAWLTLGSNGVLSGTPTASAYLNIGFSMADGVDTIGRTVNLSVFDIEITTPARLPNATQNVAGYSAQIAASGGTPPYSFTNGGGLPGGLFLNSVTGLISGTPTSIGNSGFNITVTDANHVSSTKRMSIDVIGVPKKLPSINPYGSGWPDCTFGVPCRLGVSVSSGGTAPFTWTATGLPGGFSIAAVTGATNNWMTPGDAEIMGVPTQLGLFNVQVTVRDADNVEVTNTFPLRISPLMARDFDGTGTRGEAFEAYPFPGHYRRIRVIGGEYAGYPAYNATIVSGQLPSGLTLDTATQTVSGTPIENGSFGVTLDITDSANPQNRLRTSQGFQIGGGTTTLAIGSWDLGIATIGQNFSWQLSACCVPNPYTWSPDPANPTLPAGLSLSAAGLLSGTITGSPGVVTFLVRAADSLNPANYGVRLLTLRLSALTITTNSLQVGNVGGSYTQTLLASGGSGPLTWTVPSTSYLPPGVTLSTAGVLSGVPTSTGRFSFLLQVADTGGSIATRTFSVDIYPSGEAPPLYLAISNQWLSPGTFTMQFTQLSASGGVGPYSFTLTPDAELPAGATQVPGMRMQTGPPYPTNFPATVTAGYIGVVADPGVYHPSIRVTDSRGLHFDAVFTVTVSPLTILSSPSMPKATKDAFYSFTMEPYGGSGSYSWSATNLPAGMNINAVTGVLSGTPTAAGTFAPSVKVTDLVTSSSTTIGFTLAVNPFAILTSGVMPSGTAGSAYSQTLSAPGCGTPCLWSQAGGSLPAGLSLNGSSGTISGTPSGSFSGSFTIQASGPNGVVQKMFSMSVVSSTFPLLVISTTANPSDVTVGSVTSSSLFAQGGAPPYTWTLESGDLPPGISLVNDAENYSSLYAPGAGYLRGRVMVPGVYVFTLSVTDHAGTMASRTFTWNVSRLSFQYTSLPLSGTVLKVDQAYTQPLLILGGTGAYPAWANLAAMPPGLSLAADTGVVSGTPAFTGSFNTIPIRATDGAGNAITGNVNFTAAGPTATTVSFASGANLGAVSVGSQVGFNVTPSGIGTTAPFTVTALTALPPGLMLASAADQFVGGPTSGFTIIGVPTAVGTYTFTLRAQDSAPVPNVGVRTFTVTVIPYSVYTSTTLSDTSVGTPYSLPLIAFDNVGAATWSLAAGSTLPPGLSLLSGNLISGTPTQAGTFSFALIVTDATGILTQRTFSLRVSPITITNPAILPVGVVGVSYNYQFLATGGGALTWSASGLPTGLTFSSAGVLSGTRTSAGNTQITVTATDGTIPVTRRFLLPFSQPNPSVFTIGLQSTALTDAVIGQNVSYTLSAAGGVPPYAWSVAPGSSLPPGLRFLSGADFAQASPGTTVLGGMPSVANQYAFDLIATDASGTQIRRTFTLNVSSLWIQSGALPNATAGTPYAARFAATGGTAPYTFSISPIDSVSEMLPQGFTFAPDGLVSGTTTSTGFYSFNLRVQDATGKTYERRNVSFAVNGPGGLMVTSQIGDNSWAGLFVRNTLTTNGTSTYTWSVVDGALPPGVTLVRSLPGLPVNSTALYGAVTTAGTYTFTLRATDEANPSLRADHAYTWRVVSMQVVAPAWVLPNVVDVPSGQVGAPYSFRFKVAGGTAPYVFTELPMYPLPAGLSLSADGLLSGTPQSSGSSTVYFNVTDATGASMNYGGVTLIIAPAGSPAPLLRLGNIAYSASVGVPYGFGLDVIRRGGTGPFSWTVAAGSSLPPGMAILPGANGVSSYLGGTPTTAGSYAFSVVVTDSGTPAQSLTIALTLTVSPLALTPDVLPVMRVGTPYSQSFVPSGGTGPYTVQLSTSSDMPPGLQLSAAGVLSGTPATAGIFVVRIFVADSAGHTMGKYYPMVIDDATGQAPGLALAPTAIHQYYESGSANPAPVPVAVTLSSGTSPFTLSLSGVPGASLSATSGTTSTTVNVNWNLSGLAPGTYTGILAASAPGALDPAGYVPVTLTVAPAPPCTYALNPTVGSAPNTGGTGNVALSTGASCGWTAVASAPWLTITSATNGTGSSTVTYSATPNTAPTARSATITVNGAVYTVTQFGTACSFAISPATVSATSIGGTAEVQITASSALCEWTASSADMAVSPASGTGSGTVLVTVPANLMPGSRGLAATIAGQPFAVTQTGIECTVGLSPYSATVPSGASAGSVDITTPAGCSYNTVLGPSWITVTSGASGVGSGTLVYSVEPNSTTFARVGSLTIGGQTFQITQEPLACSVTLDTSGLGSPFGSGAASGTIGVTTNGPNCSWTASSSATWATVSPRSGTGNATIIATIASNAAATTARSGELTIAGQTVTLAQSGTACTFDLESSSGSASASGGSASVRVIAPGACAWNATSNASWLTITASGSAGTSAVEFSAAPNASAVPRVGTLTIAGLTYTVSQAGAACSFAITGAATSPLLSSGGAAGESFAFSSTFTGCSPVAISYADWITIDATTFAGTAGTVTYSVAPNPSGAPRTGTIQVGNALFTVTQSGAACAYSLNAYGKVFRVAGGSDAVLGSPTAVGCTPDYGTDQPSFITLGSLARPAPNIFSLPYTVSPFSTSLTAVIRFGRITFGGQIVWIKQLSW